MKKIRYILLLLILFTATFAQLEQLVPQKVKDEVRKEIGDEDSHEIPSDSLDNLSISNNLNVDKDLASPLSTYNTFISSMGDPKAKKELLKTMNLSFINAKIRQNQGIRLSEMLEVILKSVPNIITIIENAPTTNSGFVIIKKYSAGNIALNKNSSHNWVFSLETMSKIENIFNEAIINNANLTLSNNSSISLKIATKLSRINPKFSNTIFLLHNWQWLMFFVLILLGAIIHGFSVLYAHKIMSKLIWKKFLGNSALQKEIGRPIGLVLATFFWQKSIPILGLSSQAELILFVALKFLLSISVIWALWKLNDWLYENLLILAEKTESKFDDLLVPMLRTALRIFVICIGLLIIADALDLPIYTILSGLTIGSFAVALAAKDTVENLFGSITVLLDRPFHVGDWVIIDKHEGTVEKLGFRSTNIRTFYNSVITIPNANLIKASIDNMGRRVYRRIKTYISITYSTPPEKILLFTNGIRNLIEEHPYTRKDYYHVYLNQFNSSSLDILLYCFVETPDWSVELRERERLFLDIMRLAQKLEIEFAFPTQTIHMAGDKNQSKEKKSWNLEDIQKYSQEITKEHFENGQKPGLVIFPKA